MSKVYKENKNILIKNFSNSRYLLGFILVFMVSLAFYLIIVLVSFSPSDPSWLQTAWHDSVHNLGGGTGAWIADTLFFIFGIPAYTLPLAILFFCWNIFLRRNHRDCIDFFVLPLQIGLKMISILLLLFISCSLADLNINDFYHFSSGGIIGNLLSNTLLLPWFSGLGANIILLFSWIVGLTLFTGYSWFMIAEEIGAVAINFIMFISNYYHNTYNYHYTHRVNHLDYQLERGLITSTELNALLCILDKDNDLLSRPFTAVSQVQVMPTNEATIFNKNITNITSNPDINTDLIFIRDAKVKFIMQSYIQRAEYPLYLTNVSQKETMSGSFAYNKLYAAVEGITSLQPNIRLSTNIPAINKNQYSITSLMTRLASELASKYTKVHNKLLRL